jgi:Uma2 family endonuclease
MADATWMNDKIIVQGISFEDYMQQYAGQHAEWVNGAVIPMSPVSRKHDLMQQFLVILLRAYLKRTRLGQLLTAPFVMKVGPESSAREPDLHIVLNERANIIQETMTEGAADVVIEIVSPESESRDMVEKYREYEAGGVREYWLINPARKQADFYNLGAEGLYQRLETQNGIFRSKILPRFTLDTAVLWQADILEDDDRIRMLVDTMLNKEN